MSKALSGARVVFELNNTPVLYANAVSYEVQHKLDPLYELDSMVPAEYSETVTVVSFTVSGFRAPKKSAMSQGIIPQIKNIIVQPELTATLLDQITATPIFTVDRVKVESENFAVDARSLATAELRFKGIVLTSDFQI